MYSPFSSTRQWFACQGRVFRLAPTDVPKLNKIQLHNCYNDHALRIHYVKMPILEN